MFEQSFLLPLPKFRQHRLRREIEQREERWLDAEQGNQILDELTAGKRSWSEVMALSESDDPIARLSLNHRGQSLLHLAVLADQMKCLSQLARQRDLLERRDAFGLTPLELALFLHKQKSARLLNPKIERLNFLEQPHVSFDHPERIRRLNLEYLPQPVFDSPEILGQILQHTMRAKQNDEIPHERIWMGIYFDREIQRAEHPPVSIRWISEPIGFGVFADKRIAPCSLIGEYTGLIQKRRAKHKHVSSYSFRYTTWHLGQSYVVDAERMGNFTRFINHSSRPNAAFVCSYWRGLPRLIILALSEIPEGAQITIDYGQTFWKQASHIPKFDL